MIEKAQKKKQILKGYVILLIPIILNYIITSLLSYVGILQFNGTIVTIFFIVFLISLFYVLIVLWIPNEIALVIMEPGTGIVIGLLGAPVREYHNIVEEKKRWYGGIRIVGIPGLHNILQGEIEAHNVVKGKVLIEKPKSIVDKVSMMERSYGEEIFSLDTSDKQPLYVRYMIKGKVVGIINFLFGVDKPIKMSILTIDGALRQKIQENEFDFIFSTGKQVLGDIIWKELVEKKEIERAKKKYGLEIIQFIILNIDLTDNEAVRATFLAKQAGKAKVAAAVLAAEALITQAEGEKKAEIIAAEAKKKATIIIAEGNSEGLAEEIGGSARLNFCKATSMSLETFDTTMQLSPDEITKGFGGLWDKIVSATEKAYELRKGGYFHYDTNGGSGISNSIFEASLAAGIAKDKLPFLKEPEDKLKNSSSSKKIEPVKASKEEKLTKSSSFTEQALLALQTEGLSPEETMKYFKENGIFDEDAQGAFEEQGLNYNDINNIIQ
ncbi:MAG: hypothetical protein WC472_01205 [Candidatus Paceibacterota bacterium]